VSDHEIYLLPPDGGDRPAWLARALEAEERELPGTLAASTRARLLDMLLRRGIGLHPVADADPLELTDGAVTIEFWPHYILVVVPRARIDAMSIANEAIRVLVAAEPLVVCDP
jgi:hypothetical protein